MKKYHLLFIACLIAFNLLAQSEGDPDPGFGKNGVATARFAAGNLYGEQLVQYLPLPDGGGIGIAFTDLYSRLFLFKFTAGGEPDPGFGNKGLSALFNLKPLYAHKLPDATMLVVGQVAEEQDDGRLAVMSFRPDGSVNTAFGKNGRLLLASFPGGFYCNRVTIQPDGKYLFCGSAPSFYPDGEGGSIEIFEPALARFNSNGTLDYAFGNEGLQKTSMMAGSTDAGYSFASFHNVEVQDDGRIVAAGINERGETISVVLARYLANGKPDITFGSGGLTRIDTDSENGGMAFLALQNDGKVVVATETVRAERYNLLLARVTQTGKPDPTFNRSGIVPIVLNALDAQVSGIAMDKHGSIILSGFAAPSAAAKLNQNFIALRFKKNGAPDRSFSRDGRVTVDFAGRTDITRSLVLQQDGKIVLAGGSLNDSGFDMALVRLTTRGAPDPTFGKDGKILGYYPMSQSYLTAAFVQADGKVIAAGGRSKAGAVLDACVVRFNKNGSLDKTLDADGKLTTRLDGANAHVFSIAGQHDGNLLVAGIAAKGKQMNPFLLRYKSDGKLDASFSGDGVLQPPVNYTDFPYFGVAVALQSDGKILLAMHAGSFQGGLLLQRYHTDGTPDTRFGTDGTLHIYKGVLMRDYIKLLVQKDDRIILGANSYAGFNNVPTVFRFEKDGKTDQDFSGDGKLEASNIFMDMAVQPDGKLLVLTSTSGDYGFSISRYGKDGTPDFSFNGSGTTTKEFGLSYSRANSLAVQTDGRIVIGGVASRNPYYERQALLRLNSDGSVDQGFSEDGIQGTDHAGRVYSVLVSGTRVYAVGQVLTTDPAASCIAYLASVNKPPVVHITAPATGGQYPAKPTLNLAAQASDPDGRVTRVEFYQGNTLLATERYQPYTFTWSNVPAGVYELTARAYDNQGKATTSAIVSIRVTAPAVAAKITETEADSLLQPVAVAASATKREQLSGSGSRLEQNSPNPAGDQTVITYYLQENTKRAFIRVADLNGRVLRQLELRGAGSGQVQLSMGALTSGYYLYSLWVDGAQIATRKMIVNR